MDIRMPEMEGLEATRRIVARPAGPGTDTRIIILTTFDLDQNVYAALAADASCFLLKDVSPEHLIAPSSWPTATCCASRRSASRT